MTPRLSAVLDELDLPLPELQAARLDGDVYAVGDGFSPIDEQEQAHHRAQSLRAFMLPRLIAERMTAAWIHGGRASPPAIHEVCVSYAARARVPATRRYAVREVVLDEHEIVTIGGLAVTTPLRTAIDLLRSEGDFGASEHAVVLRLLEHAGFDLNVCRETIEHRHKLAGKRRALARLDETERRARS